VDIPGERRRRAAAAGFAPADDVAVDIAVRAIRFARLGVVRARVGRIDRLRAATALAATAGATGAVGQGQIDIAVSRVDRAPFGTIHLGRAGRVGREARAGDDLGTVAERNPVAAAVLVE